ncbi:2-oxoglutarate dehydrogenase,mitochondrial [Elysia marginata]|uniref:2-oxoglutarate dehydrogenase, mitochondrial n=1 Tax=Elysia marginata TaxID=1093978 RepID=A0AAV4JP83_9GAST|nr:2-oxoglutarate dehydrogenase,mitochondrial [Elysia marginata]
MLRIRDLLLRCPRGLSFPSERFPAVLTQSYRSYASDAASNSGSVPGSGASSRQYATMSAAEPFMNGSSSAYIEDMFEAWQKDPNSVHKSQLKQSLYSNTIQKFYDIDSQRDTSSENTTCFENFTLARPLPATGHAPHFLSEPTLPFCQSFASLRQSSDLTRPFSVTEKLCRTVTDLTQNFCRNGHLMYTVKVRGHNVSQLDPLGIRAADLDSETPQELIMGTHKLSMGLVISSPSSLSPLILRCMPSYPLSLLSHAFTSGRTRSNTQSIRGHRAAQLDPLHLEDSMAQAAIEKELQVHYYNMIAIVVVVVVVVVIAAAVVVAVVVVVKLGSSISSGGGGVGGGGT